MPGSNVHPCQSTISAQVSALRAGNLRRQRTPTCGNGIVHIIERELISERTAAGLASARARGRVGGRPFTMTPGKVRFAMASMGKPETNVGELCTELGISRQTLYRHVSPTGEIRADGTRVLNRKEPSGAIGHWAKPKEIAARRHGRS